MGLKDELVVANDPNENISDSKEETEISEELITEQSESLDSNESIDSTTDGDTEESIAEDEPEEEEEEDLVDPHDTLREQCSERKDCTAFREELERCNDRVNSKSQTTETCSQELYDMMHCVDHCAAKTLWKKLK